MRLLSSCVLIALAGTAAFACSSKSETAAPTAAANDGFKNGDESDVDCGGGAAPKCNVANTCRAASDCASGVCAGARCAAPTATDGVTNGLETDVDCGGVGNPKCAEGKRCAARDDCATDVCTGGACALPADTDGVLNGTETDIDCGGPAAKRCADGKKCAAASDCTSDVCTGTCAAPSPTDGKKNGSETDVDCGGATTNPRCARGKSCLVGTDCASSGCTDQKKCAAGRSCTNPGGAGANTCGLGGAGGLGAPQWEDCCESIEVTTSAGTVKLDKYETTAGRMRVFLESVGYDVRAFVKTARAEGRIPPIPGNAAKTVLDAAWDPYLPTSFDGSTAAGEITDCDQGFWDYSYKTCCENFLVPAGGCPGGTTLADNRCHYWNTGTSTCPAGRTGTYAGTYTAVSRHLGGTIFRANAQTSTGCYVGSPGTHAFRFPDGKQDGEPPSYSQAIYDTKAIQCVDYLLAQAFCVWDGGRLETIDEWTAAYGPGAVPWSAASSLLPQAQGTNTYWGCRFPWATDASHDECELTWDTTKTSIEYADYNYSYEYPKLLGTDYLAFISAPGRTRGRGPLAHADVIGNVFELTSTVVWDASPFVATHRWTGNGSWEGHVYNRGGGGKTMLLNKYGKLGIRCAKL
jgi:hypothetical protein